MSEPKRVYCHCQFAQVVPKATKEAVLNGLLESDIPFEAVADLCELSAKRDPRLGELLGGEQPAVVAACYPRAVKWLCHSAGITLDESQVTVVNMRTESPDVVLTQLALKVGDPS